MSIQRWIRSLFFAVVMLAIPASLFAQVGVSLTVGPPALAVYAQPVAPGYGYLWTPGYWASGPNGYFWVGGAWVQPPSVGVLWTPGYWGWGGSAFAWNAGYWGPTVGFYGGVNYGYGYGGSGYQGGYWRNNQLYYNTSVNNINRSEFHNTYNKTVVNERGGGVSYNGGKGGTTARPTATEISAAHANHVPATSAQRGQEEAAGKNRAMLASVNHGKPAQGEGMTARSKGATPAESKASANKAAMEKSTANREAANKASMNNAAMKKTAANEAASNKAAMEKSTANREAANKASMNNAAMKKTASREAASNKASASHMNENTAPHAKTASRPPAQHAAMQHTAAPKAQPAQHAAMQHAAAPKAQPAHESAPQCKPPTH